VPRPPNPFICFRQEFSRRCRQGVIPGVIPGVTVREQRVVSMLAGKAWTALPPDEKAKYVQEAALRKWEHTRRHKGYNFRPQSK
ncbi:hypothetical protein DACRYDRAFT_34877, partial [Dacryopinax primogenitus]